MRKILQVTTIAYTAQAFLLPLVDAARRNGYSVDLAANGATASEGLIGKFDALYDLGWTRDPRMVGSIVRASAELQRIVDRGGYDLVHLHTPIAAVSGRAALRSHRAKGSTSIVYTAHGFHFYQGQAWLPHHAFTTAERIAGMWTDWLVVMNEEDRKSALRLRLVPPERLVYIPGIGVDVDYYSPSSVPGSAVADVRKSLGIGAGESILTMIAELNQNKRPLSVIDAFAASGRCGESHLVSLGFGALRETCERRAAELGIRDRVHFVGYAKDVRAYVLASVATVLFSAREGIPRSSLESLSMGVPVIGSDIRGIKDLLGEDEAGWLVPSGDTQRLAAAMADALDRPAVAGERGAAGRELVRARYAEATVLAAYMDLYGNAIATPSGRSGARCE